MEIAVILPAYNEELTIKEVVRKFYQVLPDASFYVVDNNSSDKTGQYAQEVFAELGCRGTLLFVKRQGKANAVRHAFTCIDADMYVMCDADLTYDAGELPALIAPVVAHQADMVVGDRHSAGDYQKENKRQFHNFGNTLVRQLINLLFHAQLKDIMSGYRVFTKKFVKNYPILCEGFEMETEMTLHALDKRFIIEEIPISYKDRPAGSFSKLHTIRDGFRVLGTIFGIFKDYKPMIFFSIMALLLLAAGLVCGLPVIAEFIKTRFITHVPLAILAAAIMILAMFSFFVGLLLDAIEKSHKFDYEQRLVNYKE